MTGSSVQMVIQTVLTVGSLVLLVALYRRDRQLALALVWGSWLFTPLIRRLLDLGFGFARLDVLSLAPFALTALAALLEFRSARMRTGALLILGVAAAGFLVGVPAGLGSPMTMLFGLFSYGSVLLAFVLGYAEARRHDRGPGRPDQDAGDGGSASAPSASDGGTTAGVPGVLGRVLLATAPVIAVYAIVQYFFLRQIPWDVLWATATRMNSLQSPERGHLRVWSTLNSPVPLALVMAVALLLLLTQRHRTRWVWPVIAVVLVAFAFTYVRSVWLGLVGALALYIVVARSPVVLARVAALTAVVAAVLVVGSGHPSIRAVGQRVVSITTPDRDVSAQAREDLVQNFLGNAAGKPLGHGVGTAATPSRIGDRPLRFLTDNGYLAVMYQSGPVGLALIVGALGALWVMAARLAWLRREGGALHLAALTLFLFVGAFNDNFFGIAGALLWYLGGRVVAMHASPAPAEAPASRSLSTLERSWSAPVRALLRRPGA
jgi:hypothetical protein